MNGSHFDMPQFINTSQTFKSDRAGRDIDVQSTVLFPALPLSVRAHFSGSGTSLADVTVKLTSRHGDEYAIDLYTIPDRGVGEDLNVIWKPEELWTPSPWLMAPEDGLKIEWSNPGDIDWTLIVSLLRKVR